MKCVNFDEKFEQYASAWMRANAAKYRNNIDRMEARMPAVYEKWLKTPVAWLDGATPGGYFGQFDDAKLLVDWMLAYHSRSIPAPDQLMERITALGTDAEALLCGLLDREDAPAEARLTAITMLTEMGSAAPARRYIDWIARRDARDERADMAAEALTAIGPPVVADALSAFDGATEAGRETLLDVLSNFPGEPRVFDLTLAAFLKNPERRALYASLLGKLGDPRAVPALRAALGAQGIGYLDYVELRNAIEALGEDAPDARDFAGDPAYEALRRME